jgi:methionyl-tRNA formyltransferase
VAFTVVYAGTPEFAVASLEALAATFAVRAVLTQPDRPAGRGRALSPSPVKRRALALGIEVLQPASLRDPAALQALAALAPDVLVVVAYGLLLPPAVLAVPRLGCINVHASLLPRWRGAAPIQRAILAGDEESGVAIMRMEAGLDTGPVYALRRVPIGARDTALTLGQRLAVEGADLLTATLSAIEAGSASARPQPSAGASYAEKLDKSEAPLNWHFDAAELDRRVRAFVPWPVAETRWRGGTLKVHAAEPVAAAAGPPALPGTILAAGAAGIDVATGEGALRLTRVQQPGRKVVEAGEFARGAAAGALVGARFESP